MASCAAQNAPEKRGASSSDSFPVCVIMERATPLGVQTATPKAKQRSVSVLLAGVGSLTVLI